MHGWDKGRVNTTSLQLHALGKHNKKGGMVKRGVYQGDGRRRGVLVEKGMSFVARLVRPWRRV